MRQLPNAITGVRVLLTPFIVVSLLRQDCHRALLLSLIAGLTDALDGYMARLTGAASRSGAFFDPIADKILFTSLYVCFGLADLAPDWLVWLVVGRDALILAMAGYGLLFTGVRDYPPSIWGKLSTVLQIGAALAILTHCAYPEAVSTTVVTLMFWLTAIGTAWSGADYVSRALATLRRVNS